MRGDKGGISRGEKLFQELAQGDKLKKEIERIRETFDISVEDFSYSPYKHLLGTKERSDAFRKEIDIILQRNALPLNAWWRRRLMTHVLSDDRKDFLPPLWDFEMPFVELVKHHVDRDGSYNDMRLYEGATQKDVRDFVAKNWKNLKPSYRVGTAQKIRGQKSTDAEMIAEAKRLMKLSRSDLGISKGIVTTKEIEVSNMLKARYGKKITGDALKARLQRAKKRQR